MLLSCHAITTQKAEKRVHSMTKLTHLPILMKMSIQKLDCSLTKAVSKPQVRRAIVENVRVVTWVVLLKFCYIDLYSWAIAPLF